MPRWLSVSLGILGLVLVTVDHRFVRGSQGTIVLVGYCCVIAVAVLYDRWRRRD